MLDSNKNSNIIDSYSKAQIENKILESQQEPIETLERLRRFITCGIISSKNYDILKELNRKHLCGMITHELLRSTLMKKLGPDLKKFCSDFALICKLDYTLKFAKSLCDAWIKKNNLNSNNIQDAPIVFLINIFLDILIRLVHCYNDLTYNNEGGRQRIGLELLGLNRSTELSERIIDLLLSDRISEGINWIASETTAWYY